jgi:tetratricopeptide (TPR) repeat protein
MELLSELLFGLFRQWLQLPLVERWVVACLVIGPPSVYLFETVRYARLRRARNTIHLAPVSLRGKLIEKLGPGGVALALRAELLTITGTLKNLYGTRPAPYIAPATRRGTGYYIVGLRQEVPIPIQLEEQTIHRIEQEMVLQVGTATFSITDMMNALVALVGALPVYGRRRYKRSQIHIDMVASEDQTLLTLHVPSRLRGESAGRDGGPHGPGPLPAPSESRPGQGSVILTEIRETRSLEDLKDLIRDAAFMILQVHGSFGQRSWRSMRHLLDGMAALDQLRRSGDAEAHDRARSCFQKAAREDPLHNHEALYFHGTMVMVDRTAPAIDEAIVFFKKALETPNFQLQALLNANLAYCYAQSAHRLGRLNQAVLDQAARYSRAAEAAWREYQGRQRQSGLPQQPLMHPLIPYTKALVGMINLRPEPDHDGLGRVERFWRAVGLCQEAIRLEPDNGMFYNNLGWALLKLVEWGQELLPEEIVLDEAGDERSNPLLAERYLQRSILLNPRNKLSQANLCLLYSTVWFRNAGARRYLARSRHHGNTALQIDPKYINGHRDYAIALVRYGELDEAYCYFTRALRLADNPDKKEEITGDILAELDMLEAREVLLQHCRYQRADWETPARDLIEPDSSSPRAPCRDE